MVLTSKPFLHPEFVVSIHFYLFVFSNILMATGTCTHVHIPTFRETYLHIIKNKNKPLIVK